MKKLVFLLVTLTSLLNAQNDSITFFAYTDYNNNCVYEPGSGEVPLTHLTFNFDYSFTSGYIQSNLKTTNDTGYITFHAPSALPATNTISVSNCNFLYGGVHLSTCGTAQNLAYNTTYSLGVTSSSGPMAFNLCYTNNIDVGSFICAAPDAFFNISGVNYNYTGNNTIILPITLSFLGGSTNTKTLTFYTLYNAMGCGTSSMGTANPFTNPELGIPGIYTVSVVAPGINAATYTQTFVVVVDSCQRVVGKVYVDCNANCNKDANEYNCDEEVISATNGTYSTTVIPDYNGNYNVLYPYSASQYTATIIPNTDFVLACATPSVVTFAANTSYTNYFDNTLVQTAVNNINYFSYLEHPYSGSSVPGGTFKFRSYYDVSKPDYCSAVNNAGEYYIKLDQNSQLVSLDPGTPNYTAVYPTASGDSIVWALADLRAQAMNLGGHNFVLNIMMKPSAAIGFPYTITSGVISNVTETTLLDNIRVGSWLIGGPFDPNYIKVTPKGVGTQGYIPATTTELYYTINFQNVGNAPAVNVKVKDLLDANLDVTSLKILGSSFPVVTNIDGSGMATFMFNHIMLADSTNDEPNSHGFVTYKINLKPGLVAGTQFTNTASIYFDYNSPVVTNTTINTLQSTSGLQELNQIVFNIYPNPSRTLVNVNSSDVIKKISVMNVLGEIVQSIVTDSKDVLLNISELKPNVYFLQITTANNQVSNQKIIKE